MNKDIGSDVKDTTKRMSMIGKAVLPATTHIFCLTALSRSSHTPSISRLSMVSWPRRPLTSRRISTIAAARRPMALECVVFLGLGEFFFP